MPAAGVRAAARLDAPCAAAIYRARSVSLPLAQSALQQLQATGDTREQIVEVVREAAGKLSNCLHLLGLAQGIFGMGSRFDLLGDPAFQLRLGLLCGRGCR